MIRNGNKQNRSRSIQILRAVEEMKETLLAFPELRSVNTEMNRSTVLTEMLKDISLLGRKIVTQPHRRKKGFKRMYESQN